MDERKLLSELLKTSAEVDRVYGLMDEIGEIDEDLFNRLQADKKFMDRVECLVLILNHSNLIGKLPGKLGLSKKVAESMAGAMTNILIDLYRMGYDRGKREVILGSMVVADETIQNK